MEGHVDSDFAGYLDKRKSTTGNLFMLSNCMISWKSSLQAAISLSSTEIEFVIATEATKESMRFKGILNKL